MATETTLLDRFNEQGYAIIRGLLDLEHDIQPVFDEYAVVLDALLDRLQREGKVSSTYARHPLQEGEAYYNHFQIRLPYEVIGDETPMHAGPAIFNLLRSPRLLDGIEAFIGPETSCNPVNVIRLKPAQRLLSADSDHAGISRVPWHQDLVNYPIEAAGTDLLTVWVPLTDATEEMGCLQVVPGSHKGGLETHCPPDTDDPIVRKAAGGGIPEALVGPREGVPLPMRAGDVLFMHRLTKHASLSNVSDNFRWSFDLRYHPTHQFSGQPLKPSWVARSRAHPETELTAWTAWARMWGNARAHLSRTSEVPAYLRYSPDNPVCAPS